MPDSPNKPFPDPLIRNHIFPDPAPIFAFSPVSLKEALQEGLVVLDTNVLLVPYTTGQASLGQIQRTYETLARKGQLRIPGQVAREFAGNRAEKLKLLYSQLSRKRDINFTSSQYPLLEGIRAYQELVRSEKDILKAVKAQREALNSLLETVSDWNWDDPVSQVYKSLFGTSVIVDPDFDRESILAELKHRHEHRIPPGYKDAGNEYSGVGDFVIWKTLLEIGKRELRDVVFVSGDEKVDWRYQSENQALYPRFELLDEFRRASDGKSLLIISFARLLAEFKAPQRVVEEIKTREAAAGLASVEKASTSGADLDRLAALAVRSWLRSRFPESKVTFDEFGSPTIRLEEGPHGRGYEVQYFRYTNEIGRRIREQLSRLQTLSDLYRGPVTLVFVFGTVRALDLAQRIVARHFSDQRFRSGTQVIGGLLKHQAFESNFEIERTADFQVGARDEESV